MWLGKKRKKKMAFKCAKCGAWFDEVKREWQKKDAAGCTFVYCSQRCTDEANP